MYALCNAAFHASNHPALSRMGIFLMKNVFDVVESTAAMATAVSAATLPPPTPSSASAASAANGLSTATAPSVVAAAAAAAAATATNQLLIIAQTKRYASQLIANICTTLYGHKMFSDVWMLSSIVKLARTANVWNGMEWEVVVKWT